MSRSSYILTLALLCLLAACGNLPRPFQPDDKSIENPLLVLGDRAGIIVMPIAGVDTDEQSQGFAEAMAKALRDVDVNAHTGSGNKASPTLSSFFERKPGTGGVLVLWLSEPGRGDYGNYEANVLERDIFVDGPRRQQVLRRIAEVIAEQVNPGAIAAPLGAPPVFIGQLAGLKADIGRPVQRALDSALRRGKLDIAEGPGGRAVTVAGTFNFRDKPQDVVAIEIEWRVLGPDGAELGQLSQQNEIPARVLQRAWPEIANAIAENAAEGIIEIVGRTSAAPRR